MAYLKVQIEVSFVKGPLGKDYTFTDCCPDKYFDWSDWDGLTLNGPIATKAACFSRLLKCLRSLYGKQCGPRSDAPVLGPHCLLLFSDAFFFLAL